MEVSNTPTHAPSKFLALLYANRGCPIDPLLKPYLRYEAYLRQVFASKESRPEWSKNLINLIDIYDSWPPCTIYPFRPEGRDETKYIMPLSSKCRAEEGSPAFVNSIDHFKTAFEAFTYGSLRGLDWSNIAAAGSSVLFPLLPPRVPVSALELAAYYQQLKSANNSDIDLFLYGLKSKEDALERIRHIAQVVRDNQHNDVKVLRTENTITFISNYPYRHIQVILRLYKSISEILTGFDVDCACVAFDGKSVYTNPRGAAAVVTQCNTIDLERRSPSYENRLYKYRNRGFEVYWESLERTRVDLGNCCAEANPIGLARLIFFEQVLQERCKGTGLRRLLVWIGNKSDCYSDHTVYDNHVVPYGEMYTPKRIRSCIARQISSKEFLWGDINAAIQGDKEKKFRSISFKDNNPGEQGVGSFNPITDENWTDLAYSQESMHGGRKTGRGRRRKKKKTTTEKNNKHKMTQRPRKRRTTNSLTSATQKQLQIKPPANRIVYKFNVLKTKLSRWVGMRG